MFVTTFALKLAKGKRRCRRSPRMEEYTTSSGCSNAMQKKLTRPARSRRWASSFQRGHPCLQGVAHPIVFTPTPRLGRGQPVPSADPLLGPTLELLLHLHGEDVSNALGLVTVVTSPHARTRHKLIRVLERRYSPTHAAFLHALASSRLGARLVCLPATLGENEVAPVVRSARSLLRVEHEHLVIATMFISVRILSRSGLSSRHVHVRLRRRGRGRGLGRRRRDPTPIADATRHQPLVRRVIPLIRPSCPRLERFIPARR